MFFELKSLSIEIRLEGTGKESVAKRMENFYSCVCRCVSCRTISLPSFNGFCCKLIKMFTLDIIFGLSAPVLSFVYFIFF